MENTTLLEKVEDYATDILKNQLSKEFVYHNLKYTQKVLEEVKTIGKHEQLSKEEMESAQIAAWFLKTGFRDTYIGYEEKSKSIAAEFLIFI